jgi:hypothetical protein
MVSFEHRAVACNLRAVPASQLVLPVAVSPTACCSACEPLLAVTRYHKAATYAVQQHSSGSAVHVLCGLLLVLHHQLATYSNKQQHKNSIKAPRVNIIA